MVVTNRSSKRSNYSVSVVFETVDGDEQLGAGYVFVRHLEPGQSTTEEASTFDEPPAEGFECRLVEVNRHEA